MKTSISIVVAVLLVPASAVAQRQWKFSAGGTPEVTVENVAGSIAVQGGAGTETVVEASVGGGDEAERARWVLDVTGSGSAVRARACCGPCDTKGQSCSGKVQVDFKVKVPSGGRLAVRSVSGDVDVQGVTGDHRIQTTSGDMRLVGGRQVTVKTVSGDLKAEQLAALTVETVSGDVAARAVSGEIKARTVSGDVEWAGTCAAGCRVSVNTTSGDLRAHLTPASSCEIRFRSTSGDLENAVGAAVSGQRGPGGGEQRARLGGGQGSIDYSSVSGDLRLTRGQ